jgi:hypothetical protein
MSPAAKIPGTLVSAQVEAGVVPWTAHFIALDDSIGERAAVVRADRADREEIVAAAD